MFSYVKLQFVGRVSHICPEDPDADPSVIGWRIPRWESVQKLVVIQALLDSVGSPLAMMATWTTLVNNTINKGFLSNGQPLPTNNRKRKGSTQ
jgi:hypothetical protein